MTGSAYQPDEEVSEDIAHLGSGLTTEQVILQRILGMVDTLNELTATTARTEAAAARTEAKVDQLKESLNGLARLAGRTPSGQALGAAVQQILTKVEQLD